jgi:hypothetical protein
MHNPKSNNPVGFSASRRGKLSVNAEVMHAIVFMSAGLYTENGQIGDFT